MRVLLSNESKMKLFSFLKEKYNTPTFLELSVKMRIPFKTIQNWMYSERYIPSDIIPKEFTGLEIINQQEDNWGAVKGGKIGGKNSAKKNLEKFGKEKYSKIMRQRGKKAMNNLRRRYRIEDLTKMTVEGKIRKREMQSEKLRKENESFFENEKVTLILNDINYSKSDRIKKIKFPTEMTVKLAEEIGVHLGDGCMSKSRNYFSVKTNKKEENYMKDYLFPMYKELYNLDLKLMTLQSVVGFEVYSKALCEFKNKVFDMPYGEKIHKIEIPRAVINTKNKEIYCALIRGLFDTDGCLSIIKKNSNYYPVISITIKSEKLIQQVEDMLRKMGFIPYSNRKSSIALNGWVMFKKWVKEINSNNSKNIEMLRRASSITG